jgi:hypothetical protein
MISTCSRGRSSGPPQAAPMPRTGPRAADRKATPARGAQEPASPRTRHPRQVFFEAACVLRVARARDAAAAPAKPPYSAEHVGRALSAHGSSRSPCRAALSTGSVTADGTPSGCVGLGSAPDPVGFQKSARACDLRRSAFNAAGMIPGRVATPALSDLQSASQLADAPRPGIVVQGHRVARSAPRGRGTTQNQPQASPGLG